MKDHSSEIFLNSNFGIFIIFRQYITNSAIISFFLTFIDFIDIPVFWPFLLLYFLSLVIVTIGKIINHKKKLGYSFFDNNKWN
jgi:hypothetical protein